MPVNLTETFTIINRLSTTIHYLTVDIQKGKRICDWKIIIIYYVKVIIFKFPFYSKINRINLSNSIIKTLIQLIPLEL